ncbi:TonB-dependent receptor plug domain-containing protein [Undibacterium sp. Di24W]|uniref:TonB-dependent receptor plug domain-containing protein n=1 Tax=Undibacterium sp. Di24W TaxID=3413033 RepID=UPI003BF157FD
MKKLLCCVMFIYANSAYAQAVDEVELALAYGDAATVKIATGSKQSLRRAPAVVSVFTAEDIRAMGATDLQQILERVPGFHVSRSYFLNDPKYQIRGIQGDFNQQILLLIDGVRHQSPHTGGHGDVWVNMPTDQIERVEIIRGPGSALYGADAVSGVISITTKNANASNTSEVHFNTIGNYEKSLSFLASGLWNEVTWAAYARLGANKRSGLTIAVDAQTPLDTVFNTKASQAPGLLNDYHHDADFGFKLGFGDWNAVASLKHRQGLGSGVGLAQALSPDDRLDSDYQVLTLNWQPQKLLSGWESQAHISLTEARVDSWLRLFPKNAFGGMFPQGMIGTPGRDLRTIEAELGATYLDWTGHRLRVGMGASNSAVTSVRETKNFNFVNVPGVGTVPLPIGQIVDVSATAPYIKPVQRRLLYALIQDEWAIAPDWSLTAGLRHDNYSDFGSTTNPRLALVWEARHDLTVKLLHGQAFRAPAFVELYTINNPVALGNRSAQPERMATSELVFDWQPNPAFSARVNAYSYLLRDILRQVPNADPNTGSTTQNQGKQKGHGWEAEILWRFTPKWRFDASVSSQHSSDSLTNTDVGYAPQTMLKFALDGLIASDWHTNLMAYRVADRKRSAGDLRPAVADYTLVDVSFHWRRDSTKGWRGSIGIRNLTNADAREPSPAPGAIRYDIPLPGRQFVVQGVYAF